MTQPDPSKVDDERKREAFQSYRRGWKNGACFNAKDTRFTGHTKIYIVDAYLRGYSHGQDAATLAGAREAERIGYDPRMSVLRSEAPAEPPPPIGEPTRKDNA